MRRLIALLFCCFAIFSASAQFYGTFYHADPDAWMDKEPYFACLNSYTYYGYGQDLQYVRVIVNEDEYQFSHVWKYGTYITVGYEDGIDIAAGDVISLYVGNVFIGTWIYNESNALSDIKIRAVRGSGKVLRGVWKMLKKRI